jgi:1-acyl-sn-glycerol-3-phosphate acyltransferase
MTTPTLLTPFNAPVLFTTLRGVLIIVPWLLYLFLTGRALSALLPISFFAPTTAYKMSSKLAKLVWLGIQTIFTRLNRARITTSGDALPRHESALIVANHVSWADFYLIQHLAIRTGMLGRCRWFAKQQLKWVPFLGWGLWAMGYHENGTKIRRSLTGSFADPKSLNGPFVSRTILSLDIEQV